MAILAALIAFLVTLGLTRYFCKPGALLHILDHPNERSLHTTPTPRSGGIALLGGLLAGGMVLLSSGLLLNPLYGMALAAMPIALVSLWDDYRGVPVGLRLSIHGFSAVLLVWMGYDSGGLDEFEWVWLSSSLTGVILVLAVIWMINLYNFMDGMDGLAAGMAVFGFSCFAIFGLLAGDAVFAGVSLLIVAASTGFLVFNAPPAKIFLGDLGSTLLGFLVAAFSFWGYQQGLFSLWVALLVFSPFIVDATLTLLRRLYQGEKIWQAHKTHYYQRLVQMGWSQRRVLLTEYALMSACGLSALYAAFAPTVIQISLVLGWVLVYSGLTISIGQLEKRSAQHAL